MAESPVQYHDTVRLERTIADTIQRNARMVSPGGRS